jgi:hypothetical protein
VHRTRVTRRVTAPPAIGDGDRPDGGAGRNW